MIKEVQPKDVSHNRAHIIDNLDSCPPFQQRELIVRLGQDSDQGAKNTRLIAVDIVSKHVQP